MGQKIESGWPTIILVYLRLTPKSNQAASLWVMTFYFECYTQKNSMSRFILPVVFLVLTCCMLPVAANAETTTESTIKAVTVYKQNAKVTREATITLTKGNNEIVLGDLTQSVLAASLQVRVKGNATLLSAAHRTNYLKDMKRPEKVAAVQDTLDDLNYDLQWLNNQLLILQGEEKIITSNNPLGSKKDEGFTVNEMQQLTVFYRKRLTEIKREILDISREVSLKQKEINRLNTHLRSINQQQGKPTGELVLQFYSPAAKKIKIECSYLINNAGWSPLYDLKSKSISAPVKLVYKANVYQNSGHDWKNIDMKVSTNNPTANNSRPILNPQYVQFYVAAPVAYQKRGAYQEATLNMATVTVDNAAQPGSTGLNLSATPPEKEPFAIEFDVPLKQEIPSDGIGHIVLMEEYNLPAQYIYHVVPKVDLGVFLIAKITNYGQYNLVAGNANIFFEDTYVGQSYINPSITSDTLLLSFGRDDQITVKRSRPNNLSESKTKSGTIRETHGYEIKVRNNKSTVIDIEVLDQIPIAQHDDIEVKLTKKGGAEYVEEYGKLLWTMKILPGTSQITRFEYRVKYPKGKFLTGL